MAICHEEDCTQHLGCRLRAKGMQLSPKATPTKTRRHKYRPPSQPSWEAGVAGERRPDGSFMPYLDADRNEMGVKEYAERRRDVDAAVGRLKSDPTVFSNESTSTSAGG